MSSPQNSIHQFDFGEHIRLRPGMYIAGRDSEALHRMIFEVLGYMAELAYKQQCDHIWVELHPDNRISIGNNSGGISVEPCSNRPITELEAHLQLIGVVSLHRLGDYNLGLAVANALSVEFIVDNCREGVLWQQTYHKGKPYTQLIPIAASPHLPSGTTFTFIPDFTILERNEFDLALIEKRAQELACQLPHLTVEVRDLREQPYTHQTFYYPEGLKTFVQELNAEYQPLHELIYRREKFEITLPHKSPYEFEIEIAFQFSDRQDYQLHTYVNTLKISEGTQIAALKAGLAKCFGIDGRRRTTAWKNLSRGLTLALAIFHSRAFYESISKSNLMNPEIYKPIIQLMTTWHDSQAIARIKTHYAQQYPEFADILG